MLARLLWFISLPGLCLATWLAWQHRFVAGPDGHRIVLGPESVGAFSAVRAPALIDRAEDARSFRIRASSSGGTPTLECALQALRPTEFIWIRIRASGERLVSGTDDWEIARVMLLWRGDEGRLAPRQDGLCGLTESHDPATFESVVRLRPDLGTPIIAFQNLAREGVFTVHSLEVIPVTQRPWVPAVTLLLMSGWFGWTAFAFRRWLAPRSRRWRVALGALAWVALAAFFLFPGPYYPWRPMRSGFDLGVVAGGHHGTANHQTAWRTDPSPPNFAATCMPGGTPAEVLLKPDEQGDPVSVLFRWKKHIRGLLHVGAFAAMVIGFSTLLGPSRAWIPVAVLGVGTELMQWLWGYGFDRLDVYDLVIDVAGIGAGLIAVWSWNRWRAGSPTCRKI